MKINTKFSLCVLAIFILLFASCGTSSTKNNIERDYYTGADGVTANFQRNSPPAKTYYDEDTPDDNVFDIFVDIHNGGSSFSKGGVYLSGYDPSMIKIKGIDIEKTGGNGGDCDVSFGFNKNLFDVNSVEDYFGEGGQFWKGFSGSFDCQDSGVSSYYTDDTNWGTAIDDLGELTGYEFLDNVGLTYDHNGDAGLENLRLSFGDDFDIKYLNHGTGLLILMSGMSFSTYNGREYLLRPDTIDYPGGERITEGFEVKVDNWPQGLDELSNVPFLLTNCYLYTTFSNTMVCIDPAPYEDRPKVCTATTVTSPKGQGAPVGITKIITEPTKNKVIFDIEIKNLGSGQIFDFGKMTRCGPYSPGKLTRSELNKVHILDARIGEQQLECTPSRGTAIEIVDGVRNIRCEYNIDYQTVKTAYQTPLIIEIGYGYQEISEARMQIKRI